jgi:hypothetical protein
MTTTAFDRVLLNLGASVLQDGADGPEAKLLAALTLITMAEDLYAQAKQEVAIEDPDSRELWNDQCSRVRVLAEEILDRRSLNLWETELTEFPPGYVEEQRLADEQDRKRRHHERDIRKTVGLSF